MSAPVRYTCPDIDRIIKSLVRAEKDANEGKRICDRNSDEYSLFDNIADELYRLDRDMEDLRSANDALRQWGEGLDKELADAADQIYDLEQKVNELS